MPIGDAGSAPRLAATTDLDGRYIHSVGYVVRYREIGVDPEVQAMSEIAKALEPLDQDATKRVLKWAIERFQVSGVGAVHVPRPVMSGSGDVTPGGPLPEKTFASLADLFDEANPQSGLDRVLVVAYWHQKVNGEDGWDSQSVNAELKDLGHQSSNITRDLGAMIKRTPRLVIQVRQEGSTKQARKVYKLTREGLKAVENMLNASAAPTT